MSGGGGGVCNTIILQHLFLHYPPTLPQHTHNPQHAQTSSTHTHHKQAFFIPYTHTHTHTAYSSPHIRFFLSKQELKFLLIQTGNGKRNCELFKELFFEGTIIVKVLPEAKKLFGKLNERDDQSVVKLKWY